MEKEKTQSSIALPQFLLNPASQPTGGETRRGPKKISDLRFNGTYGLAMVNRFLNIYCILMIYARTHIYIYNLYSIFKYIDIEYTYIYNIHIYIYMHKNTSIYVIFIIHGGICDQDHSKNWLEHAQLKPFCVVKATWFASRFWLGSPQWVPNNQTNIIIEYHR